MPLADLQRQMRECLVGSGNPLPAGLLVGGATPARRFDIHRRHYEESLTAAVIGRFAATGWLIGTARLEAAARAFVHRCPPEAPCIAEYGSAFPTFLGEWPETRYLAYLPSFATLDWHVGRLAVAVDLPAMDVHRLATEDIAGLPDRTVTLQPGLHYQQTEWPVDVLLQHYLNDSAPGTWTIERQPVSIEVRGARGLFRFARRAADDFTFRTALAEGATYGAAAATAMAVEPTFDPAAAFVALVWEGLVVALGPSGEAQP